MYTLYIYIILIRIAIIVYETILQNANFTGAKLILNSNSQKQAAKKNPDLPTVLSDCATVSCKIHVV